VIYERRGNVRGEFEGEELFKKPLVKLYFIYFSTAICDFHSVSITDV
jgi:hypothetical protein